MRRSYSKFNELLHNDIFTIIIDDSSFSSMFSTTDFADFTDYSCALMLLFLRSIWISQIMTAHGICAIRYNPYRNNLCYLRNLWSL